MVSIPKPDFHHGLLGEASAQGDMPVAQAELETLGFHHGELGGVLAQSQSA